MTTEELDREWAEENRAEMRLFLRGVLIALFVAAVVALRLVVG
jgi:hypothetical protein